MFYWRCSKCGGPSEMAMLCEKCKKIEADALGTATTSKKIPYGHHTTQKGEMSSATSATS